MSLAVLYRYVNRDVDKLLALALVMDYITKYGIIIIIIIIVILLLLLLLLIIIIIIIITTIIIII